MQGTHLDVPCSVHPNDFLPFEMATTTRARLPVVTGGRMLMLLLTEPVACRNISNIFL